MWNSIETLPWGACVQVGLLAVVFYYTFLFFRGTRGAQVLIGLTAVLLVLVGLTRIFNLDAINWLLSRFPMYLAIGVLIIFQPEIRAALAELGRQPVFAGASEKRTWVDNIVQAVEFLAQQRLGALIAIEREIGTRGIQETGVKLDATVVPELLTSLFFPHTPLHDGGVIIRGNRILAAGCIFPLSQQTDFHKPIGTRHRAAIGLSEETDAVVIVVSEESGTISVCYRGRLSHGIDGERLRRFLSSLLLKNDVAAKSAWRRVREKLDLTPSGIAQSEENRAGQEDKNAS